MTTSTSRERADIEPSVRRVAEVVAEAPRHSMMTDAVEIVRELWHYRELLQQLTRRDIKIRYKQAVMGFGWAIFMPAMVVLAGLVVKYVMAQFSGRPLEMQSIASVVVKSLPWAFFVGAIGFATSSMIGNKNLVAKIYFPREVFPLSSTLAQTFDSSIGAAALVLALPFLGVRFSVELLWVPLLLALLFLFTVAMGLLLSCGNLFFRDVKYLVSVFLTFGIFFTPVFFEPDVLGTLGSQLIMLNPLAPIFEGIRLSVVEQHNLLIPLSGTSAAGASVTIWNPWYLVYSGTLATVGLVVSSLLFHRLEFLYAEYI